MKAAGAAAARAFGCCAGNESPRYQGVEVGEGAVAGVPLSVKDVPDMFAPFAGGTFKIAVNGKSYTLDTASDPAATPRTTLNEFIRTTVGATGTRRSCGEGGCGACVVMLTLPSGKKVPCNSCIRPLLTCNGMSVTTTEGIGSKSKGYHPVQSKLASNSGTQCGFCSSGFVMTMYSFLQSGSKPTMHNIEKALDGNICRCTGYRPILEAFKTFAVDADRAQSVPDLKREMFQLRGPAAVGRAPLPPAGPPAPTHDDRLPVMPTPVSLGAPVEGATWVDATSEADLQSHLASYSASPPADLMLVAGNTSSGIFKTRRPDVIINIGQVPGLGEISATSAGTEIGTLATLTEVLEYCEKGDARLAQVAEHLHRVASYPLRCTATIGGSLMLAHKHSAPNFPSDLATLMLGLGATLEVVDGSGKASSLDVPSFLSATMEKPYRYLRKITIPPAASGEKFLSFRTAERSRFAKAYSIAAMSAVVSGSKITSARIAYGGLSAKPKRLASVEKLLAGASITDEGAFQKTLCPAVKKECAPPSTFPNAAFCADVAVAQFYKFFLSLQSSLPSALRSAVAPFLDRPVTKASQAYDTDPSTAPVGAAIPKLEGIGQVSGEVHYTGDVPIAGVKHAALVLATKVGTIGSVDTSEASKLPGFLKYVTHADVADGGNVIAPYPGPDGLTESPGELFASTKTQFIGQYIGVVVADTARHATACARAVKVNFSAVKTDLVLTVSDAVKRGTLRGPAQSVVSKGNVSTGFSKSQKTVTGEFDLDEQYHFHMETQTAAVVPGSKIYSACQRPSTVKSQVAASMGVAEATQPVEVVNIGGAYGGKASNAPPVAAAAGVAAKAVSAPVKIVEEIEDNMQSAGKRVPYKFSYKIGFNNDGTILAIQGTGYAGNNSGIAAASSLASGQIDNCYNVPNWDVQAQNVSLDVPQNTWMRAPSQFPSQYFIEWVIMKVATETGLDGAAVREKNFYSNRLQSRADGSELGYYSMAPLDAGVGAPAAGGNEKSLWNSLKKSADYASRLAAVKSFNAANKWTKKGISMVPSRYGFTLYAGPGARVEINSDGSISQWIGGVEVGQGIYTKVAQTVAYELRCDITYVHPQPTTTSVTAGMTGGSTTSEYCCKAAIGACGKLKSGVDAARKALGSKATWPQIAAQMHKAGATTTGNGTSTVLGKSYQSYSAIILEATVDVLTGEVGMDRADILFDCGRSLNPDVDIGQCEGAYMIGAGLALQEAQTRTSSKGGGSLKEDNTWGYKVPTSFDIPAVWNTTLLKDAPNPSGILSSKASGEPPILLSFASLEAVNMALAASNADRGAAKYVPSHAPFSVDARVEACALTAAAFNLK